jgi:hypothetical protein
VLVEATGDRTTDQFDKPFNLSNVFFGVLIRLALSDTRHFGNINWACRRSCHLAA